MRECVSVSRRTCCRGTKLLTKARATSACVPPGLLSEQEPRTMFQLLAAIFFCSVLLVAGALAFQAARVWFRIRWTARLWAKWRRGLVLFYCGWFGLYACFILFATGPSASDTYPPAQG